MPLFWTLCDPSSRVFKSQGGSPYRHLVWSYICLFHQQWCTLYKLVYSRPRLPNIPDSSRRGQADTNRPAHLMSERSIHSAMTAGLRRHNTGKFVSRSIWPTCLKSNFIAKSMKQMINQRIIRPGRVFRMHTFHKSALIAFSHQFPRY